jgi:hypothetical protein
MGGFALDIRKFHNTLEQGMLTTHGLLFLADQGYFFEISSETITDKSKANLLAKSLVCLQVLWVAGQTIERKIAGYPISLLEFHTLVHVFCALVMYALWIQKPYDVNEPTVISADVAENALAFIVASSRWEGKSGFLRTSCKAADLEDEFDEFYETRLRRSRDPRFFYYGALKKTPQVIPRKVSNSFGNQEIPLENLHDLRLKNHFLRANVAELKTTIDLDVAYYPGERVGNYYNISNGIQPTLFLSSGQALRTGLGPKIQLEYEHLIPGVQIGLSDKDLNRLNMTGAFISDALSLTEEHGHSSNLLSRKKGYSSSEPFDPFNVEIVNRRGRRLVCQRENNMLFSGALIDILETVREPGLENGRPWHFALLVVALITIPTAYGGIHLSALHAMFPTRIESILWKASCFTLLSFAGFLFLSMIISWFPLTL